jgi:hypothetical protein
MPLSFSVSLVKTIPGGNAGKGIMENYLSQRTEATGVYFCI